MTQRLAPTEKAARRRLRSWLHLLGGHRLVGEERSRAVAGFIRRTVIEIDEYFPGALASESIIGIDVLLKSSPPPPGLEELALKLAELQERLHTTGNARRTKAVTVH
jgi:hypothetical protein